MIDGVKRITIENMTEVFEGANKGKKDKDDVSLTFC